MVLLCLPLASLLNEICLPAPQAGSPGCLLISGLAEPVVKAYSLILDLIQRCHRSQSQHSQQSVGNMESQLAFRSLVEHLDEKYILDLLVLPRLVKEVLLDLVTQAGVQPKISGGLRTGGENLGQNREKDGRTIMQNPEGSAITNGSKPSENKWSELPAPGKDKIRRVDGEPAETGQLFCSVEVPPNPAECRTLEGKEQEHEHLLQFFTAMGFHSKVVSSVLTRTGPREPSQVLDLIQKEHSRVQNQDRNGAVSNDFVMGVVKRAAASCGYTEDKVEEIFSNLPELSPHQMILELQKETPVAPSVLEERLQVPPDVAPETTKGKQEVLPGGRVQGLSSEPTPHNKPSAVCGPPRTLYPPRVTVPPEQNPGAVITGQQRFLEGLETTFKLQLKDDQGDPGLRQIIIDGSNVAMT